MERILRLTFCSLIFTLGVFSQIHGTCLDLETAYLRVMACHPALEAVREEIAIHQADRKQVSLSPNPIFSIEAENLGVSDPQTAEPPLTTYSLSQLVELGGKKSARRNLAIAETHIAALETATAYQDLRYEVMETFIDVSFHEEKVKIAQNKVSLTKEILNCLDTQVRMNKLSPIQHKQASLTLGLAEIELQQAQSEFIQAKLKLAMMWGNSCPDFDSVNFDFYFLPCLSPFCHIADSVFQTIDYQYAQQKIVTASQNLKLQKANSIPDITVNVGYRVYENTHEHGWVVGAAIPLPVFDKNQGNIEKASHELSQAQFQLDQLSRELQEKTAFLYEQAKTAWDKAETIHSKILNAAKETLEMIEKSYEKGKLSYIDLLEAKKSVLDIEENYLQTLNEYHVIKAQLGRLQGEFYCL